MRSWIWRLRHVMGVPQHVPSWREQLVGSVTALAGIALVAVLGWTESLGASPWLLTSMGATAVLVFTVPHGMLSQPWAVLGGHTFSALSGLLVLHVLGQGVLACAVAVSLSIGVMHVTRCIHPPGGATTLFVVQSASTAAAGLDLLLSPVLLNVASILLAAVALNYPFAWRRYPAYLAFRHSSPAPQQLQQLLHEAPFAEKELAWALDGMDETFDISDEQIQLLYEALSNIESSLPKLTADALEAGAFYSNGLRGEQWGVRQIVDANAADARKPQVIVKTVAGKGKGKTQLMTRQDFADWARYPVYPDASHWTRDKPEN